MMTIFRLMILTAVLFALGLLVGCNTMPAADSPEMIAAKVDQAIQARETLWAGLQKDRDLFTEEEWAHASGIHAKTVDLSAQIVVGLSTGQLPPVEDVDEWIILGTTLYDDAVGLMLAKHAELSFDTQSAWALEKARLAATLKAAQQYVENPDAYTYATMARVGLLFGKIALATAIGL